MDLETAPLSGDEVSGQQASFLKFATYLAQEPRNSDTPYTKEAGQLEAVVKGTKHLLSSLEALSEAGIEGMSAYAREVVFDEPSSLSDELAEQLKDRNGLSGLLEQLWDQTQALAIIAERTREGLVFDRQAKPADDRARALVSRLALRHFELCGKWPTANPASWFGKFAAKLGEVTGVEIGRTMLGTAIKTAREGVDSVDRLKSAISDASS